MRPSLKLALFLAAASNLSGLVAEPSIRVSPLFPLDRRPAFEAPTSRQPSSFGVARSLVLDVAVRSLSAKDRFAIGADRPSGDGGSFDFADIFLFQSHYLTAGCPAPETCADSCNEIVLTWNEPVSNIGGVEVYLDGELIANAAGVPEDATSRANGLAISGPRITSGRHTFRIEEPDLGTFAEASMVIVDAQPFSDVTELSCEQGLVAVDGSCQVSVSWSMAGRPPSLYLFFADDQFIGTSPAAIPGAGILGFSPGQHCVEIAGVLELPEGNYRGCFVETCCDVRCEDNACRPPVDLRICQYEYGLAGSNSLFMLWQPTDADWAGVDVVINRQLVGTVPSQFDTAFLGGFPTGPFNIGIRGNCAGGGLSTLVEQSFTVLRESPHTRPIEGTVDAELDPVTETATLSWKNAEFSIFTFVWVIRDPLVPDAEFALESILPGRAESTTVDNVTEQSILRLMFFAERGGCYASAPIDFNPRLPADEFYLRGLCGPGSQVNLSAAIFGLNHLFSGGAAPGCRGACDVNADGAFNLTDMVHLLLFLFQGGSPPAGWTDASGDGVADPTCVQVEDGVDCASASTACP
jgi:hypothetical protein